MAKTCVIYCRTSTAGQRENETIEAQVLRCRAIVERHGLTPLAYGPRNDGWVLDDGVSGSLLDGRHMSQLLNDLESKAIKPDVLVVYSITRISRVDRTSKKPGKITDSHVAAGRIRGVLISSGVSVIEEDGEADPASMIFSMKLMMSDEEYKVIRARTISGKAKRLGEGLFAKGGKPPYGYEQIPVNGVDRKQGFTLVKSPGDAPRFQEIVAWFLEGGVTHAAKKATDAGFETPMFRTARKNAAKDWTPTRWSPVSIQHIIRNASVYLGSMSYELDGERYTITYPALITPGEYARILKRQKERTLKKRATMITTGYTDCACGAHIYSRNSHGRHWARCANKCGGMRQEHFESYVSLAMTCRYAQIAEAESVKNTDEEQDAALESLKVRIGAITDRIAALLEVYLSKDLSKPDWKAKHHALESERATLQNEWEHRQEERRRHRERRANEQTVESRVRAILSELAMGKPTLERQREVLRDLLGGDRVIVHWTQSGATLTFPPFGSLPAVTVSTDADIFTQMLGPNAQDKHGLYVSLRDLGKPPAEIARGYVEGLPKGAKVTGRAVRPDGSISLTVEYKKPKR